MEAESDAEAEALLGPEEKAEAIQKLPNFLPNLPNFLPQLFCLLLCLLFLPQLFLTLFFSKEQQFSKFQIFQALIIFFNIHYVYGEGIQSHL